LPERHLPELLPVVTEMITESIFSEEETGYLQTEPETAAGSEPEKM
jgi:hypothetical protein